MQKISVVKWMLSGNKDNFYDSLEEAMRDQKPGAVLEQVAVVEEVKDQEDVIMTKREQAKKAADAKKAAEEQEKKDWEAKELDDKGNPIEDKPKENGGGK